MYNGGKFAPLLDKTKQNKNRKKIRKKKFVKKFVKKIMKKFVKINLHQYTY